MAARGARGRLQQPGRHVALVRNNSQGCCSPRKLPGQFTLALPSASASEAGLPTEVDEEVHRLTTQVGWVLLQRPSMAPSASESQGSPGESPGFLATHTPSPLLLSHLAHVAWQAGVHFAVCNMRWTVAACSEFSCWS